MAIVVELYRAKVDGKWWVVLSRNKKGAVHMQKDVSELFEKRFQEEIEKEITELKVPFLDEIDKHKNRADNLERRVKRAEADQHSKEQAHCAQVNKIVRAHEDQLATQQAKFQNDIQQEARKWEGMVEDLRAQLRDMIVHQKREIDLAKQRHQEYQDSVQKAFDMSIEDGAQAVHRAWAEEKMRQGFHHRSVKPWWHFCFRCHRCLVPYSQLAEGCKEIDRHVFRAARGEIKRLLGKFLK